jgi:chromosome segregation ATPase
VSSLQAALSRAEADAERLSGLLAAAEAAAAAAKGREDSARAAGREYVEHARRAETLLEEGDAELAEVSRPCCSGSIQEDTALAL